MPPLSIPNVAHLALPEVLPVSVPIGEPVAQMKFFVAVALPEKEVEAGVWECTPGVWRRQIMHAELCHFAAGHCIFTPEDGQPIEIKAGDAIFFPANSRGVWDIKQTLRKTYVTFVY